MRTPLIVLLVQVVIGLGFVAFVLLGGLPGNDADDANGTTAASAARAPNRFDGAAAFRFLRYQVRLGERPAGSRASRTLAARLRRELPRGRYQRVPGGLRNVVGTVAGTDRGRVVVVGAHYDTKDIDGFVGANDGASGTAVLLELARTIKPRTVGPTLKFVFFDGEESPRGTPDSRFAEEGLRGSKVAARAYRDAEAMILLDFVGDRDLSIPREGDRALWSKLRAAARRAHTLRYFPAETGPGVIDDHTPFLERGIPAIDLIDFDFPCFHRTCDDLSAVSRRSVDAVGETVLLMLSRL
ncbi:MAG: M28 family metallopeptidase [Thermoleophilaceae bacterium]